MTLPVAVNVKSLITDNLGKAVFVHPLVYIQADQVFPADGPQLVTASNTHTTPII